MTTVIIPDVNVTRESEIEWFAYYLLDLFRNTSGPLTEISTEFDGDAIREAYEIDDKRKLFVLTTFDLSEPFQELWYQCGDAVIKAQTTTDMKLFGTAIEAIWQRWQVGTLDATGFVYAMNQLQLRLSLLTTRTMRNRINSARLTLR